MAVIDLKATIDPVLGEHYPGLGMQCRYAGRHGGFDVTTSDGRRFDLEWSPVAAACAGVTSGWESLFDALDKALARKPAAGARWSDVRLQEELDCETQGRFPAALLRGECADPHVEVTPNGIAIVDHAGRRIPLPITRTLRQLAFQLQRCADQFELPPSIIKET
jgi:hypothetical protein